MPLWAVSFTGIGGGQGLSAHQIFPGSDRLKVGRIDARVIAAQVVNLLTGWYLALCQFVGKSVGRHQLPIDRESAVSLGIVSTRPFPAMLSDLNVFEEPFSVCHKFNINEIENHRND